MPPGLSTLIERYGIDAVLNASITKLEYPATLITGLSEVLELKIYLKGLENE